MRGASRNGLFGLLAGSLLLALGAWRLWTLGAGAPRSSPGAEQEQPHSQPVSEPARRATLRASAELEPGRRPAPATSAEPESSPALPELEAIDLATLPDFGPTPDTSAEEWAQMSEWCAQWLDIDAGAAGKLARLELQARGRKAVPVILNAFKRLDFADAAGHERGEQCRETLAQICNGTRLEDPPDLARAAARWASAWLHAERDIRVWIRLARLEERDPAEAQRLLEMFGLPADSGPPSAQDDEREGE